MNRTLTCFVSLPPCAIARAGGDSAGFVRTVRAPRKQVSGNRVRVNSPDTAAGPYKNRSQARMSGLMTIPIDDGLSSATRASRKSYEGPQTNASWSLLA